MANKNAKSIRAQTTTADVGSIADVPDTKQGRAIDPNSKASKANAIFTECYAMNPVPQRKDIIDRAIKEAGLTQHGAATYLHNFRNKHGMVTHRTK